MCFFKYGLYIIGQREKSLSGVATYSYTMKPTPTGVVFTEATVQEIHHFTPHYEIGDATQMETRQDVCSDLIISVFIFLCGNLFLFSIFQTNLDLSGDYGIPHNSNQC